MAGSRSKKAPTIDALITRWKAFEALVARKKLSWAYHHAPPWLRHARLREHPRGVRLDLVLPAAYTRFVSEIGYPCFGTGYYDSAGLSFLPPEPMAVVSAMLADPEGELPRATPRGPTPCRYAFFAGYELSDVEGFALGPDGDQVGVWLVERGMAREFVGSFEAWLAGTLDAWEARVKALRPADVRALEAENDGEDDPHRLIDYALGGSWRLRRYAPADLALSWVEDQAGDPYRYGLIDAEGRWLIPMGRRFRSVTPFRKGLAKVILNDKRSSYEGPWVTIRPDGSQVRGK
ncbi:MAG: hypothetical protein KA190_32270 [Kofleriaceae bacterium]|nr:hypothetical protein [Kofleriaceae bacterium]